MWLVTALLSVACIIVEASSQEFERLTEQLGQAVQASQDQSRRLVGYDAVFRRSPMQPLIDHEGQLVTSAGLGGGLSVQGIIWSDDHPMAVVDDELLREGDAVGPYTILKIRPDGLLARHGAEELLVPLDRGIEPLRETVVDALAHLSLPEYVPPPLAPRRRPPSEKTPPVSAASLTSSSP